MLLRGSLCPQAHWTPGSSCHPDTTQDPLQCVPQTDPKHKYECALPWKLGPVVDIHVWGCGIALRIPGRGCWGNPSSHSTLLGKQGPRGEELPLIPSLGLSGRVQRHEASSAGRDAAGDPGPLAVAAATEEFGFLSTGASGAFPVPSVPLAHRVAGIGAPSCLQPPFPPLFLINSFLLGLPRGR